MKVRNIYCNHGDVIKIDGGFFSLSYHYKCSKCSREFDSKKWMSVCPKEEVARIVNLGVRGEINKGQLKELFSKIGIFVNIPFKIKEIEKKLK